MTKKKKDINLDNELNENLEDVTIEEIDKDMEDFYIDDEKIENIKYNFDKERLIKDAIDKAEKDMFLQELGIEESGLDKLIKEAYKLLGLRTYFTAGVQEVRAWTFKEGMTAPEMAGIIHSDFQRGFIKAETYSFEDLVEYGSEHALKEAGKIRQEGKQYVGQDGDIMLFKFNV